MSVPGLPFPPLTSLLFLHALLPRPQVWTPKMALPGAQRPHSLDVSPLACSWGTLPSDLRTPRLRRQRGAFCFLATSTRPSAPALIRLITVHMGVGLTRPPLSHGPKESPSVQQENRAAIQSPAPLRPREPRCHPFLSRLLLSCPLSLCLWVSGSVSPISIYDPFSVFLRVCLSSSSLCLCPPPFCLSTPRLSVCLSVPCISPMARIQLSHSPWVL